MSIKCIVVNHSRSTNTDFASKIDTTGITNGQILIYNTARSKFVAGDGYSTGNFNTDFATKSIHDLNDVVQYWTSRQ